AVFTDGQGRITGFWGLAISELSPAHRYESGGQVLYAWCAWDTLFLPARLGQAARVTSACPVTGELIQLTVTPDGVTETSHPGAVVSFLRPDGPFDSGVIESFCHFVHFFASRQAGGPWASRQLPAHARRGSRPRRTRQPADFPGRPGCTLTAWTATQPERRTRAADPALIKEKQRC